MSQNQTHKDRNSYISAKNSVTSIIRLSSSNKSIIKSSHASLHPLEITYLSRNLSHSSENFSSFNTEQIMPSNRISVLSEDTTEAHSSQFKFEKKIQNTLKSINYIQKFCNVCRTNTYFIERNELQQLNALQYLSY